jgi:hypothetical protein
MGADEAVKPVAAGSFSTLRMSTPLPELRWITADARTFHAENAPGKRFKFYGPNLCFSAQYLR